MTLAENNRISHRQLYRQLIMTFTAPFLLCLFQEKRLGGIMGILGTLVAVMILLFYVIFLIRLTPRFENLPKSCGRILAGVTGIFFLGYTILSSSYLVSVLMQIVPESLIEGAAEIWIGILAVAVCSYGSYRGMQRRGRMAEVSGALLLVVVILMMVLSLGQARIIYFQEMLNRSSRSVESLWKNGYGVLCAFSGIGLLPFLLNYVEKPGSAWRPVASGILTVGVILEGMLFLLPAVFGWDRLKAERMPILPLLSGANLPGKVLARFDVLWMGFVLYGLLYAIGSLFHYSHLILETSFFYTPEKEKFRKTEQNLSRQRRIGQWKTIVFEIMVLFLSVFKWNGNGIQDFYLKYLGVIFIPGLLLLQIWIMFKGREQMKKRLTTFLLICCVFSLTGCAGIEPEKRMYPLAIGIQEKNGEIQLSYGMPDLQKTTGQGKAEEGKETSVLSFTGKDFGEIEKKYSRSQEKYLDLGHLKVMILDKELIEGEGWKKFLTYMKEKQMVGEDIYLFAADDPLDILEWQNESETSVGDYLTGILENDDFPDGEQSLTLRDAYHDWYQKNRLIDVPSVKRTEESLEILASGRTN